MEMYTTEKEGPSDGEPYSIRFRAQFGDVGPFTVQKTEISLDVLTEKVYESWPKGTRMTAPDGDKTRVSCGSVFVWKTLTYRQCIV